jgi:tRNA uridine 5-carboxymethylaminomethyl modification enzyme
MIRGDDPVILRRDQAYAAVMIDDLVTQGTEEPYRMFTSRAEHRLLLGCDSVYERLSPLAARLGLLDDERKRRIDARISRMQAARDAAETASVTPDRETLVWLSAANVSLHEKATVARLMQRADFDIDLFTDVCEAVLPAVAGAFRAMSDEESDGVVSQLRYAGYIERQQREAARQADEEGLRIPAGMSYRLPGLSREMVEKLSFVRPVSLGQASRIPGVTPAAISIVRMHLRRGVTQTA